MGQRGEPEGCGAPEMDPRKIGFLGFGEVGSCFARDLTRAGALVRAYDKYWNTDSMGPRIRQRGTEAGVVLAESPEALLHWGDVFISVTSPVVALETARTVEADLREGQVYADFNSATPRVKQEIARVVGSRGCAFVDGGILGSPRMEGHRVPIVVSGSQAAALASMLNGYGMQITVIGSEPGQASALKVIRSIFTKGLESVLLECLVAAQAFGIRKPILTSVIAFLESHPAAPLLNMLMTTHAVHAHRRAGEMAGVLDLLTEAGIDSIMTDATRRKLQWSADLGVREFFHDEVPSRLGDVIEAVDELSRSERT